MRNIQEVNDFNEILRGRRSIRTYDTSVKISKEEMVEILEEATLAPSSLNMQPWRFLVIESKEGKQILLHLQALIKFKLKHLQQ